MSDPAFAYLGENTNNTGYTNNFLTERHANRLFTQKYKDYNLFEEDKATTVAACSLLTGIVELNELTRTFFSKANLDHLQNLIIKTVYEHSCSKWKISRQSDNEMYTIMRSLYLQYGKNMPTNIAGQVADLNKMVLLDAVPRILTKIQQQLAYEKEFGNTYMPMARGQFASSAGTKTNKGFSSLFI